MNLSAIRAQIALLLLPGVGIRHAKDIIACFGSAEEALAADKATWLGLPMVRREWVEEVMAAREKVLARADKEVAFIEKHSIRVLGLGESDYPQSLAECPDAPLMLFTKGNIVPNKGHFLSVVGTRRATDRGRQICHDLLSELMSKVPDLTIVSGLAYGIDIAAHRTALEAHRPTWIIPAHGLDRIYPPQHRNEAIAAMEHGGILTEYMSGTVPEAGNFVARNRIVAGLSAATLVVESAERGGSLITARIAQSYGRDVLAVPGRPSDAASAGCNNLIKQNRAALVETADDVIAAIGWEVATQAPAPQQLSFFPTLSPLAEKLLAVLRTADDGIHINLLVMETRETYAQVSAALFEMEIAGVAKSLPGGIYRAL